MTQPTPEANSRPRTDRQGLTLTEMLIVVTLIGILTAIAGSGLDWTRYRADGVIRGLGAQLSAAQRTAVSLQDDVRVTVPSPERLRIHEDANNNGVENSGERITQLVLEDGFVLGQDAMSGLPFPADPAELTTFVFRRDGIHRGAASAVGADDRGWRVESGPGGAQLPLPLPPSVLHSPASTPPRLFLPTLPPWTFHPPRVAAPTRLCAAASP